MKTIQTVSVVMMAMILGSAALDGATGLPLPFAVLAAASAVTLSFAATVVIGALVNPARAPLTLLRRARAPHPITRPVRVGA
jgi:hypothetical protein